MCLYKFISLKKILDERVELHKEANTIQHSTEPIRKLCFAFLHPLMCNQLCFLSKRGENSYRDSIDLCLTNCRSTDDLCTHLQVKPAHQSHWRSTNTVIGQRFTHQIKPEESHCKNQGAHCVCRMRGCTPQHRHGTLKPVSSCDNLHLGSSVKSES